MNLHGLQLIGARSRTLVGRLPADPLRKLWTRAASGVVKQGFVLEYRDLEPPRTGIFDGLRIVIDPDVDFEVKLPVNLVYALSFALPKEDMQEITDIVIPGQDAEIPARIYRASAGAARTAPLPVIVFYHGGGFVAQSHCHSRR